MNTSEPFCPPLQLSLKTRWLRLLASFGLAAAAGAVSGQTFTTLHCFMGSDGAAPDMGVAIAGKALYGTTWRGGGTGNGVVFKLNLDDGGFSILHEFTDAPGPDYTNLDGTNPEGTLIVAGATLYGTTMYGGAAGYGTVFRVNTDGTGFTNLHSFTDGDDGANPYAGVVISNNVLYGTAQYGGAGREGTVFKLNTDGGGFTVLHSFTPISHYTNSDGGQPAAPLVVSGSTLYGVAFEGGASGNGTVFQINTDGSGFTNLHSLDGAGEGGNPYCGLALSRGTLYGTACYGGQSSFGTVFKVNVDGSGFATLHSFTGGLDGRYQYAGVVASGTTLYGAAPYGGTFDSGVVFQLDTDGSNFSPLHLFSDATGPNYTNSDGALSESVLAVSGNTLYGTAADGGISGDGTVFQITLVSTPTLAISVAGTNVVLTWPTNTAGFVVHSATNLDPSASWVPEPDRPVVLESLNTLTNPIAGSRTFYRLIQVNTNPP